MEDPSKDFNFPSGVQLPFALRRKVQEQQQLQTDAELQSKENKSEQNDYKFLTAVQSPTTVELSEDLRDASFSTEDLEKRIWRATVAMVEVQKQVQRGEETYYDETFNHGNIFKGWEGFLDAKDVGNSDGVGGRKVPADYRWFSNSCRTIPRNPRPSPITVNNLSTASVSSQQQQQQPRSTTSGVTPMSTKSSVSETANAHAATSSNNVPAVADTATSGGNVTSQSASAGLVSNTAAQISATAPPFDNIDTALTSATSNAASAVEEVGTKRPADTLLDQKIPKKKKTVEESATVGANTAQSNAGAESGAAGGAKEGPSEGKVESQRQATSSESEQPSTGKKQRGRKRKTAD